MAGTSNDEVRRVASKASDELKALPGVSGVGGHIGRAITSDQVVGNSAAELWVSIAPNADFGATEQAVRDVVQGYPGIAHNVVNYSEQKIGDMHSTLEPGFAVRVYGTELPVLREKAEEVRKALENINGVKNPTINAIPMTPIVEVEVNLEAAQKSGIKPGDARRAAATLMQGIVVGNLFEEQKVFEVVVRGAVDVRDDLTSIRELLLDTPTGGHVQLGEIATVRMVPNEVVVMHDDTSRRIDVQPTSADVRWPTFSGMLKLPSNRSSSRWNTTQRSRPSMPSCRPPTPSSCGLQRLPSSGCSCCSRRRCGAGSSPLRSSCPFRRRSPGPPWPPGSVLRRCPGLP